MITLNTPHGAFSYHGKRKILGVSIFKATRQFRRRLIGKHRATHEVKIGELYPRFHHKPDPMIFDTCGELIGTYPAGDAPQITPSNKPKGGYHKASADALDMLVEHIHTGAMDLEQNTTIKLSIVEVKQVLTAHAYLKASYWGKKRKAKHEH